MLWVLGPGWRTWCSSNMGTGKEGEEVMARSLLFLLCLLLMLMMMASLLRVCPWMCRVYCRSSRRRRSSAKLLIDAFDARMQDLSQGPGGREYCVACLRGVCVCGESKALEEIDAGVALFHARYTLRRG